MRLDKFLKVSRIIKRRSVAKESISDSNVLLNDKKVKPSKEVNIGDILTIENKKYRIEKILNHATEKDALSMYSELE